MTDTRLKLKVNRPRCPYCHDDIVPGDDNRACHGCLTWHHSECWGHGGCVTCGAEPPTAEPVPTFAVHTDTFNPDVDCSPEHDCFVHDRMNAAAKQDLIDLHGQEQANKMFAEMCKRGPKAKGLSREYWDEQGCQHKFNPEDYSCNHCGADMGDVHGESYVESFIDKQVSRDYWTETVTCMSPRCEEPTTREEQFCVLCLSEIDFFGEPKPRGMTKIERKRDIADFLERKRKRNATETMIGFAIMAVFAIAVVAGIIGILVSGA